MGQRASERQLRRLQRACTPVYRQLEKQLDYARTRSLEGHYYREMLHHMISYGRWLTQDTRTNR